MKQLTDELSNFREEMTAKKEVPTKPKEKVSLVTDADREEFGEDLLNVQRKVAQEVAQDYEEKLEQQNSVIKALQDKIAGTDKQVGETQFSQRLVNLIPDFAQVDKDERWVEWLNEYDPMLNGPRRVLAQEAFDKSDADSVAHYVKLWRQSFAEPEVDPRAGRQAELEKQVAPNRSANSVDTKKVGKEAKIYSEREVNGAWTKIRNLNTKGSYDEAAKLEADITAAYLEGRVRQ